MHPGEIIRGQRWLSGPEPELGPGVVDRVERNAVRLFFPAAAEARRYAWPGAPLIRLELRPGDSVSWQVPDSAASAEGNTVTAGGIGISRPAGENSGAAAAGAGVILAVLRREGLLVYQVRGADGARQEVPEDSLTAIPARRGPMERFSSGGAPDTNADFELRREALFRRERLRRSPVRGFCGARMELIPHQLGIAAEVSGRLRPRALLADEVGLGKTIEACLILHRLLLTGRVSRVLILVPPPLVHQWFVELLRRFNLHFSLFDETRCPLSGGVSGSHRLTGPDSNPFHSAQLVLAPLSLLADSPPRTRLAVEAGWDLLIVDEAHQLPDSPGGEAAVEALAEAVPGVLLLTGTPVRHGEEGHFARLRLLDPERYSSFAAFQSGEREYARIAGRITELEADGSPESREAAAAMLDLHGTGRVMFRNCRAELGGFPRRKVQSSRLPDSSAETRIRWLAELLHSHPAAKFLLICHRPETTEEIRERLAEHTAVAAGVFHEGLTLLQRDRQAAWFAEEDGARILLCSEIGSEGRNFQFARDLVLWDLPEDPDLLEQRIGRLDRIGQRGTIRLHIPWVAGTAEEVLLRWYEEALAVLSGPVPGASRTARGVAPLLRAAMEHPDRETAGPLLEATRRLREETAATLAAGQDRLLRWHSEAAGGTAGSLIRGITTADGDVSFTGFWIRLLDALGMRMERLHGRCWRFQAGSPETETLPGFPPEGLTGTFDRREALEREDLAFFTQDHPLPRAALDLLLGGERGTAVCAELKPGAAALGGRPDHQPSGNSGQAVNRSGQSGGGPELILEVCYVLECAAPARLHADRFLPPLPVRIAVDHLGRDRSDDAALLDAPASDATAAIRASAMAAVQRLRLVETAESLAAARREEAVRNALARMHKILDGEIARSRALAERHAAPAAAAAAAAADQLLLLRAGLETALGNAGLRMDCVRLGVCR